MYTKILLVCWVIIMLFLRPVDISGQCQNRLLDFDGNNDFLEISTYAPTGNFTIEGWYFSTANSTRPTCNDLGETLWWAGAGAFEYLKLIECGGELAVVSTVSGGQTIHTAAGSQIRNGWHHIALVHKIIAGQRSIELYLDCLLVTSGVINNANLDELYFGTPEGNPVPGENFKGRMDDLRVWGTARNLSELEDNKNCVLQIPNADLDIYLKFDEGIPGGANPGLNITKDNSGNGQNAELLNFALNGNNSNFLCSNAPLIYPDFTRAVINILDYPARQNTVNQICSGDPVHLCIELEGKSVSPNPNLAITWEYDNGNGWTSLPSNPFNGFCFGVPPGALTIDCTTNNFGFEDWDIRAAVKVYYNNGQDSCTYSTIASNLRICCDLDQTAIAATTNFPGDLLCDGDTVNFNVNLSSSYPFINIPATGIDIDWSYNGTALPVFSNQTNFQYTDIVSPSTGANWTVNITNNNCGKSATYNQSFPVDLIPICGTIDTLLLPTNLTQISANPKIYEICPGDDAALKIDDPFQNCIPTWQFSYDLLSWSSLGSTNSTQNTNILPTSSWPGSNIYYRIQCDPLMTPSGCEPCFSDTLEIRLNPVPNAGMVNGPANFCFGGSATLTLTGADPGLQHQWYCNGIPVGNGSTTLAATNGGCYWVESSDGCHLVKTSLFCLDACQVTAVISCPDVCPKPDVPISLSACDSSDSCGLPLTYSWAVSNGAAPTINGCTITHVPLAGGTTYSVTVTNSLGCSDSTSTTIVPCLN